VDSRPRPDAGLTEEESGYKTGQVIKKATGKPLDAYRSLSQDFRPMHSVGMSRDEAMQYERDKQTYSNRPK